VRPEDLVLNGTLWCSAVRRVSYLLFYLLFVHFRCKASYSKVNKYRISSNRGRASIRGNTVPVNSAYFLLGGEVPCLVHGDQNHQMIASVAAYMLLSTVKY